jgi:nitroimidazol reductase NimA-like FMN-containing flavoprotein (pyridoxamine 5'-phosphate oxidase superfamily)
MADLTSPAAIITESRRIAATQLGGTLATMHAEDGTPYVTFVFFHMREDARILFGSGAAPQHTRNMTSTPEVSFLIDTREAIRDNWDAFDRIVIEGSVEKIPDSDPRYKPWLEEIRTKNATAAYFTEHGALFSINPRRLILMRGLQPNRHIVDFPITT